MYIDEGQEEFLTRVFPIPFIILQKVRHNCSWNYVSNILCLFRSVNLKEMSHKNIIDQKNMHPNKKNKCSLHQAGEKDIENYWSIKLRKWHGITDVNFDSTLENLPEMPLQCTHPGHWKQGHHYYLKSSKYKQLLSHRYGIMFGLTKKTKDTERKKGEKGDNL